MSLQTTDLHRGGGSGSCEEFEEIAAVHAQQLLMLALRFLNISLIFSGDGGVPYSTCLRSSPSGDQTVQHVYGILSEGATHGVNGGFSRAAGMALTPTSAPIVLRIASLRVIRTVVIHGPQIRNLNVYGGACFVLLLVPERLADASGHPVMRDLGPCDEVLP
jgi:hypothetical protein